MPPQAFAQFLDMRHMKNLGRGDIAEVDAVIAVAHRMPLKAGEGDKLPVDAGGFGRPQVIGPSGSRPLKALAMVVD